MPLLVSPLVPLSVCLLNYAPLGKPPPFMLLSVSFPLCPPNFVPLSVGPTLVPLLVIPLLFIFKQAPLDMPLLISPNVKSPPFMPLGLLKKPRPFVPSSWKALFVVIAPSFVLLFCAPLGKPSRLCPFRPLLVSPLLVRPLFCP